MAEKGILSKIEGEVLKLKDEEEANRKSRQKKVERGGRLVPCFDPDDCGSNAICARG